MQTQANVHNGHARARVRLVGSLVVSTVGGAAVASLCARLATTAWDEVRAAGPSSVDQVTAAVAASAATALVGWWTLAFGAAVLAHCGGWLGRAARQVAARVASGGVRRLAATVVGVGLLGALAPSGAGATGGPAVPAPPGPAFVVTTERGTPTGEGPAAGPASSATPPPTTATDRHDGQRTSPGWVPTRPPVRPQPASELVARGAAPTGRDEVVVQRGDSLWAIAARHLGPGASDAEVARAWPAWHDRNRHVIGHDPDVLLPGQLLRAPEAVGR